VYSGTAQISPPPGLGAVYLWALGGVAFGAVVALAVVLTVRKSRPRPHHYRDSSGRSSSRRN
jgi:hypothetical protein